MAGLEACWPLCRTLTASRRSTWPMTVPHVDRLEAVNSTKDSYLTLTASRRSTGLQALLRGPEDPSPKGPQGPLTA